MRSKDFLKIDLQARKMDISKTVCRIKFNHYEFLGCVLDHQCSTASMDFKN